MVRPSMIRLKLGAALALIACAAACAGSDSESGTDTSGGYGMPNVMSDTYATAKPPPMDPSRKIAEQNCSTTVETDRGNLRCR
jgi:hypothetical protein